MRISDWSSDVCSSDLQLPAAGHPVPASLRNISGEKKLPVWHIIGNQTDMVTLGRTFAGAIQISQFNRSYNDVFAIPDPSFYLFKIGRASCRERVCQYV